MLQVVGHEGVKGIAFLPSSDRLIVGCNDKSVSTVDLATLETQLLCKDSEAVKAVAVDASGSLLAYGTNGNVTHVRRLAGTSETIASLPHGDRVRSLSFAPRPASLLAVGGEDGVVRLWDTQKMVPSSPPLEQGGEAYDLDFHPASALLAVAVRDRPFVRLWDLQSSLAFDGVPLMGNDRALAARFTLDGKLLATGWADGTCWLWPLPAMPDGLPMKQHVVVDLFEPSAAPKNALYAAELMRYLTFKEIGELLGISKRCAHLAAQLGRQMLAKGITDPFFRLQEPIAGSRWGNRKSRLAS
jgi:WD40 repeat protein